MRQLTTNQLVREFEKVLGPVSKPKQHETMRVRVYDRDGKVLTTVHKGCTSVGAAKAAKVQSAEWSFRFKPAGWIVKELR